MNEELLLRPENTKGLIQMIDYVWIDDFNLTNEEFGEHLFNTLKLIINNSKLRIVHSNLTFLPISGYDSEIGFTLYLSLDSSHCSAHCYWKSKLLAIDVFGCSDDIDHQQIIISIDDAIKELSDNKLSKVFFGTQKRFHYLS